MESKGLDYKPHELELLGPIRKGLHRTADIAAALNISSDALSKRLYTMFKAKRIERTGEHGAFDYYEIGATRHSAKKRGAVPTERSPEGLGPASQETLDAIRDGCTTTEKLAARLDISATCAAARVAFLQQKQFVATFKGHRGALNIRALSADERAKLPPPAPKTKRDANAPTSRQQAFIDAIAGGAHTSKDIAAAVGATTSATTQQLANLQARGFIIGRQNGSRWTHYDLPATEAPEAIRINGDAGHELAADTPPTDPPQAPPTRTPSVGAPQPMVIDIAPFVDSLMNAVAPIIDQITAAIATPMANYVMASLQQNMSNALNSAIRTMPMPEVKADAPRKLRITIGGLNSYEAGQIKHTYGNRADFRFLDPSHVGRDALAGVENSDLCLILPGVNHKLTNGITAAGGKYEWLDGGVTRLRERLNNVFALNA